MIQYTLYSFKKDSNNMMIISSENSNVMIAIYKDSSISIKEFSNILINDFSKDYTNSLSEINLYECRNNKCYDTIEGYLKYGVSNNLAKCGIIGCKKIEKTSNCSNDEHIGNLNYDSKLKICVNSGNFKDDKYSFKEIAINYENYILSLKDKDGLKYNLYITNESGNIIGLSRKCKYIFK